ncbi:MAG TPA: molybdopterin oxidoreductase, partial [Thermodesulforhabdus norvegica]|nr:molybdopterin oxidoreductase [Thermodesulforhabdus norvegica]
MKVGRRAFIGFVAGAVGGTLLSPLPWKLADDIAIWTQNWSWRPSPERGHRAAKKTICTLCGGGCPIEVDFIDGKRAIYARGGDWGICSLGASAVQY